MSLTGQQIGIVRQFMKESGYSYTEEWLMACLGNQTTTIYVKFYLNMLSICLDWIQENYSRNELTHEFLKKTIHSQWIDADLTEMESKCLPPKLVDQRCVTLPGLYGLQINAISDIGESSYTQYNKIKKLENENTNVVATDSNEFKPSWEPKPRRVLHLTMTDGVQIIFGIEHTPINRLDLFSKPGTKVVIKGPVECRRGILLLKPSHVNVIGGEVESLIVKNSVINILSRKLNYDEEIEPSVETQFAIPPPLINDIQQHQRPTQIITQQNTLPAADDGFDDDDDIFLDIDENALILAAETQTQMPNSQYTHIQVDEQSTEIIDDGDVILIGDDDATSPLRKKPRNNNQQQNISSTSTTSAKSNSNVNSVINNYPKQKAPPPPPLNKNTNGNGKKNTTIAERKSSFEFDDDDDELMELIGSEFEKSESINLNLDKISSNADPYRFIKDITMDFHGTIKVKACVTTIIGGIKLNNSKMSMKVLINDGTGCHRTNISNDILEEILGLTASEFNNLKLSKDPDQKKEFLNIVTSFQSNLVDVNAILELSINPNEDSTIESISEITAEHIAQLKTRLSRLNV